MKFINNTTKFLQEVKQEFKKVSWPDRSELVAATGVVIVSVTALALFIGICDLVFFKLIQIFIR